MKKIQWLSAVVVVFAIMAMVSSTFAADQKAAAVAKVTITGTVAVTADAAGVVTAITETDKNGKVETIALNDAGKKVATLKDKTVTVTGTVTDGKLVVTKCTEKKEVEKKQ